MKFKVGDVVRVKSDLKEQDYGDLDVVSKMLEFKGKIVYISKVFDEYNEYQIKEDGEKWSWNDEMLEPVNEYNIKKYIEDYIKRFKDYDIKIEVKKKEPILDEEEKKYLSAVIRPFRNRVKNIMKHFSGDYEYICIFLKHMEKDFNEDICLPYFKANKMYKGMKLNKKYTLEELGL